MSDYYYECLECGKEWYTNIPDFRECPYCGSTCLKWDPVEELI
jgi:DNA-directed RNA polymerase subunit RPC12/RpoP